MYNAAISYSQMESLLVQDQMLSAIEIAVQDDEILGLIKAHAPVEALSEEGKKTLKELDELFPKFYSNPSLRYITLRDLWMMIEAADRYQPDLIQEYVLAHAIYDAQESQKHNIEDNGAKPFRYPKDIRTKAKKDMVKALMKLDEDVTKKEASEQAEDDIKDIENMTYILETVFHDIDFAWLDDFTPDELYSNGMNDRYGIGVGEPAYKVLPDGSHEPVTEMKSETIKFTIRL